MKASEHKPIQFNVTSPSGAFVPWRSEILRTEEEVQLFYESFDGDTDAQLTEVRVRESCADYQQYLQDTFPAVNDFYQGLSPNCKAAIRDLFHYQGVADKESAWAALSDIDWGEISYLPVASWGEEEDTWLADFIREIILDAPVRAQAERLEMFYSEGY